MHESDAVGRRIARTRKMRGMTQTHLAQVASVSKSMLAKVESGHASASTAWIGAVANALGVDASRLYGSDEPEQLHEVIPRIRRTLAATDLMDHDSETFPLVDLAPQVAQVNQWRLDARYRKISEVLPGLVGRLLLAGQTDGAPAYALLTDLYRAANTLSHKLGYTDLSMTATERMAWAATKSGDRLLLATARFVKAAALARIGAGSQALRLLDSEIAEVETLISASPAAPAVLATLHLKASSIAAALADRDTSFSHAQEANKITRHLRDRVVYQTEVGPTNAKLYELCAAVDLGDIGLALELAGSSRPTELGAERRTYFWLDAARAHLLNGDTDSAVEALFESRAASPEHFRASPTVKAAVRTAAQQQRRASHSLRALANLAGVTD